MADASPSSTVDACPAPPPTSRWKGPLAMSFLCAHCSLTLVTGAAALGLAALPPLFGVPAVNVLTPALIVGAFALWLWTGRGRREEVGG